MLQSELQKLIDDGNRVIATKYVTHYMEAVDSGLFANWLPACRHVLQLIGKNAKAFEEPFRESAGHCFLHRAQEMLGSLTALKNAVDGGLLVSIEDLVLAEAFTDLIEQAEELFDKKYFLAAGVICRAVFEEHLRKLCFLHNCFPVAKPNDKPNWKPMIENLKQSLSGAGVFTKTDVKNADAIAGEGNHCAHNNQPPLGENEIRGLIQKLQSFLIQHPLK